MRRSLLLAPLLALAACQTEAPAVSAPGGTETARVSASGATADVVAAAQAFQETLSADQRATLLNDLTADLADNWSNFPAGVVERNGLRLGDLSDEQREAALGVIRTALSGAGFATFQGIRAADDYLGANPDSGPGRAGGPPAGRPAGPPGDSAAGRPPGSGDRPAGDRPRVTFDGDVYTIAFLGEPSTTEPWILQFGGHHYAVNFGFGGEVASPTPFFVGTEPLTFELDGVTYAPMAERAATATALLASLSASERTQAQLSGSFRDVLLGPGQDFEFLDAQEGLPVASLSAEQRALVAAAIAAWVEDAEAGTADRMLAAYTSEAALDATTIGYAGSPDLGTVGSYLRIDGPDVWVEIAAQSSDYDTVHYHSIWRDKTLDYGGVLSVASR